MSSWGTRDPPAAFVQPDNVFAGLTPMQLEILKYALQQRDLVPGQMTGHTDYLVYATQQNAVAGKWQRLYGNLTASPKPVCAAFIQNLSLDPLTLAFSASEGQIPTTGIGQGAVLNPAPSPGLGGGSKAYINVDLDTLWVIAATAGDAFSVEWYDFTDLSTD